MSVIYIKVIIYSVRDVFDKNFRFLLKNIQSQLKGERNNFIFSFSLTLFWLVKHPGFFFFLTGALIATIVWSTWAALTKARPMVCLAALVFINDFYGAK